MLCELAGAEQQRWPAGLVGDDGLVLRARLGGNVVPRIVPELLDQIFSQGPRRAVFQQPLRVPGNRLTHLGVRFLGQIQVQAHSSLVVSKQAAPGQIAASDDDDARCLAVEWPDRFRVPDRLLDGGGTVDVAGLRIQVHDVGAAESHADSYLLVEAGEKRNAFIGDLAFDGVHSYTADGHSGAWLGALDRLVDELAGAPLYPGRGAPGDIGLLTRQRQYLLMYREAVGHLAAGAPSLSEAQKLELTQTMIRFLLEAPLNWLVGLGADAVAAELAA